MSQSRPIDDDDDGMLPEYDLSKMPAMPRGWMYERVQQLKKMRELDPELLEKFPDSPSVNRALREYLRLTGKPA